MERVIQAKYACTWGSRNFITGSNTDNDFYEKHGARFNYVDLGLDENFILCWDTYNYIVGHLILTNQGTSSYYIDKIKEIQVYDPAHLRRGAGSAMLNFLYHRRNDDEYSSKYVGFIIHFDCPFANLDSLPFFLKNGFYPRWRALLKIGNNYLNQKDLLTFADLLGSVDSESVGRNLASDYLRDRLEKLEGIIKTLPLYREYASSQFEVSRVYYPCHRDYLLTVNPEFRKYVKTLQEYLLIHVEITTMRFISLPWLRQKLDDDIVKNGPLYLVLGKGSKEVRVFRKNEYLRSYTEEKMNRIYAEANQIRHGIEAYKI